MLYTQYSTPVFWSDELPEPVTYDISSETLRSLGLSERSDVWKSFKELRRVYISPRNALFLAKWIAAYEDRWPDSIVCFRWDRFLLSRPAPKMLYP